MTLRSRLEHYKGKRDYIKTKLKRERIELERADENVTLYNASRLIVIEASRITQEVFKTKVESLVSTAIQSVFDRPFVFKLEMERKRNRLECRPVVMEGENAYSPKDEMGGGIIDIISFAFRVVLWSLEKPRTRNVFVLDEPFKFTGDLADRAGTMVKELSRGLGLQIIMITHDDRLKGIADKTFDVTHNGKKSIITSPDSMVITRRRRKNK